MRNHPLFVTLFACIALCGPGALAGDMYEDEAVGYKIRLPDDFAAGGMAFTSLADLLNQLNEYQIATFGCSKPLTGKDGDFYRRMTVYFFPERSLVDAAKEGKKGDVFLNFKDFATAKIRGFYFDSEEAETVAGFPALVYEMKFEKLTGTPKRYMVCSYQAPGGELAVVFTCTDEHFKGQRSEHIRSFKSFRLLNKDGLKVPDRGTKKPGLSTDGEGDAGAKETPALPALPDDPKERFAVLRDRAFEKEIAELLPGWRTERSEHFLLVFNTSAGVARKVERHAEALRQYLDEEFATVGTGRVQDAILKLADDGGIMSSSGSYAPGYVRTFYLQYNERSEEVSMHRFNRDFAESWMIQRNAALWAMMPVWLKVGFAEVLPDARMKGSRLVFDMNEAEGNGLAWLVDRSTEHSKSRDEGTPPIIPFKELIGPTAVDALESGGGNALRQSSGLFRFLFDGPGSKNALTDQVLRHYIAHCADLAVDQLKLVEDRVAQVKALEEAKDDLTDAERLEREDALYKLKREQSGQNLARDMTAQAFARTFGAWEDSDWDWLDKTWRSWARRQGK